MRYLKQEEKKQCRKLWEEAFPEDSRAFDDYYFAEKIKDNRILAEEEDGEIISMVQLNPCRVRVRDRVYELSYIVGVATRADRRHRGHMRRLLLAMLADMRRERVPFTFLMPAAEAIYLPFDFRFIYDQPHLRWRNDALRAESAGTDASAIRELALWQQRELTGRFEVCTVRDEDYIRNQMGELASEKGEWTLFRGREGRLLGMEGIWGLEKREQRFLYACPGLTEEEKPATPAIMARITCLEEFLQSISLREDAPVERLEVLLTVKDGLIPENDGTFLWTLDREGSAAEAVGARQEKGPAEPAGGGQLASHGTRAARRPEYETEIGVLTQWLFGYKMPEQLPEWGRWIRPLQGVFLDEVV